ncbi:hypothetical protein ACO0K7_18495 [Undibacterium sp. Ji67W]|uniref:hypothetical protein n=1 Tax=Undibacterium sp. Ji67W TaxID=3413042 RepID=UPI003BF15ED3
MHIGYNLISLVQGGHGSIPGTGSYDKLSDEYSIRMHGWGDGGVEFNLVFRLVYLGNKNYQFNRLDAGDAPTVLNDIGNNVLVGGPFTITFAPKDEDNDH